MTSEKNLQQSQMQEKSGLPALVLLLRKAGFRVGPSEAIDASRLILNVLPHDQAFEPDSVRNRLKPIFCKSRKQLALFDDIYDKWCKTFVLRRNEGKSDKQALADDSTDTQTTPPNKPKPIEYIGVLFGVVVFSIILVNSFNKPLPEDVQTPKTQTSVGSNEGGGRTPPPVTTQNDPPAEIAIEDENYYLAYRHYQSIKPLWAWTILGLLAVPALLLFAPALRITSSSRFSDQRIPISGWPQTKTAQHLSPPIGHGTRLRLGRHHRIEAGSVQDTGGLRRAHLDVYQTVVQTIKRHGVPTIVRHAAKIRPTYLILVCAENENHYFVHWAERFRTKTLDTEIAFFAEREDATPPEMREVSSHGRSLGRAIALNRLPDPEPGQRLIVVGDARAFVDDNHKFRKWVRQARFERWRERAWFTPKEPRDWGDLEEALEKRLASNDPGFLVMPLDDNALEAWSHLLTRDVLPMFFLSRPQRYPRLLREESVERFLDEAPPEHEISELIRQLKLYLDENGFFWLCCCAVVPVIDSRLTLLLGEALFLRGGSVQARLPVHISNSYPRLILLPWIQKKIMPAWLRLALLTSVPVAVQDEVRETVLGLLEQQRREPDAEFFVSRDNSSSSHTTHNLYVGFLDGRTPESLSMEVPPQWRGWIKKLMPHRSLLSRAVQHLSAIIDGAASPRGAFGIGRVRFLIAFASVALAVTSLVTTWQVPSEQWPEYFQTWFVGDKSEQIIMDHGDGPVTAEVSRDGERLLTYGDTGLVKVWNTATGKVIRTLGNRGEELSIATLSDDGQLVATAGQTIQIWDVDTGKQTKLIEYEAAVRGAEFSSDAAHLLVWGGEDSVIGMWPTTEDALAIILPHDAPVLGALFSYNGALVLTWDEDNIVRIWASTNPSEQTTVSTQEIGRFQQTARVMGAVFSADDTHVVSWNVDGNVMGSSVVPGATPWQVHDSNRAIGARFNANNTAILTWDIDANAYLWTDLPKPGPTLPPLLWPNMDVDRVISVDNVGQRLLVQSAENEMQVRNTLGEVVTSLSGPVNAQTIASFFSNGERIITASNDGVVQIWNSAPLTEETTQSFDDRIIAARAGRNQSLITTLIDGGSVEIWDATKAAAIATLTDRSGAVTQANFSQDGSKLVTVSESNIVTLWETRYGREVTTFSQGAHSAVFTQDDKRIITSFADGVSASWDAKTGDGIGSFGFEAGPDYSYTRVPELSDDGTIAAVVNNNSVLIDNTRRGGRGSEIQIVDGNGPYDMDVSPDGKNIVVASRDAKIFASETGTLITTLGNVNDNIRQVAYSPDGEFIVTAGINRSTRAMLEPPKIWNANNGDQVTELTSIVNPVTHISFSPDASRVAITSDDSVTQVFATATGVALAPAMRNEGQTFSTEFNPQGTQLLLAGNLDTNYDKFQSAASILRLQQQQQEQLIQSIAGQRKSSRNAVQDKLGTAIENNDTEQSQIAADNVSFVTIRQAPPTAKQVVRRLSLFSRFKLNGFVRVLDNKTRVLSLLVGLTILLGAFNAVRREKTRRELAHASNS